MRIPTRTVLLISSDPAQVCAAKQVLGHAAFKTVPNAQAMREACKKHKIDLIVMGHSIALAEKKDIWAQPASAAMCPSPNFTRMASR